MLREASSANTRRSKSKRQNWQHLKKPVSLFEPSTMSEVQAHYLSVWKKGFAAFCGWSDAETALWSSHLINSAFLNTQTPMFYIARELVEMHGLYDKLRPRYRTALINQVERVLSAGFVNGWDFKEDFDYLGAKSELAILFQTATAFSVGKLHLPSRPQWLRFSDDIDL
jgi:hypothetical protein